MRAVSRVSASVMRRPETNSLCLPSCLSVRVSCGAAAMDDGDLIAIFDQFGDAFGALMQQLGIFQRRAAEFDYVFHG